MVVDKFVYSIFRQVNKKIYMRNCTGTGAGYVDIHDIFKNCFQAFFFYNVDKCQMGTIQQIFANIQYKIATTNNFETFL